MSKTIDEKVVSLKFDNSNFEKNADTSLSTVEKLKEKLDFSDVEKGLQNVSVASNRCNFSGFKDAIATVRAKFSAFEVMAVTALANITNSAVNAGKKMIQAFTIEPIMAGFSEYETQINAVQTILANTSKAGTTLKQVSDALDELNLYADRTIYNFTEMTRNIGTFTAAGVDLNTSVSAIKGIANLAAVSGSSSMQASAAMYQLSQALAAGTVKLVDWNSVVNAGMGGKVFQDAIIETARVHGIAIDEILEKQGGFRGSLQKGWLDASILLESLEKFTGDLTEEQLKSLGYTKEQIEEIIKMGKTANDAATKVKTVTQLFSTLKEAAQSGWTQSWEIMVGDFEEAKDLLTEISNIFGNILSESATARNNLLQGWKDLGGRAAIIDSLRNSFEGIISIITPIKEAFREIFPPITANQLFSISEKLRDITDKLKLSEETAAKLKNTFKGLFAVIDIIKQIFSALWQIIKNIANEFSGLASSILSATGSLGEWLVKVDESLKKGDLLDKIVEKVSKAIRAVSGVIRKFISFIGSAISEVFDLASSEKEATGSIGDHLSEAFSKISKSTDVFFQGLKKLFIGVKNFIGHVVDAVAGFINGLQDGLDDADFSRILDFFNSAAFSAVAASIARFFGNLTGPFKSLKDVLDEVRGCLEAYQTKIRADLLKKIATAIAILVGSIVVLSMVDSEKLSTAVMTITALFADLVGSMSLFSKIVIDPRRVFQVIALMMSMSVSILVLASALKNVSDIDANGIASGILAIGALAAILVSVADIISSDPKMVIEGALQMVIFSAAIKVLASACKDLGSLDFGGLIKGLAGVGALIAEVMLFTKYVDNGLWLDRTAKSILVLSVAIKILGSVCKTFAQMDWEQAGRGLLSIGVLLGEIVAFTHLAKEADLAISTGISLIAIAAAIKVLASAMIDLKDLNWQQIGKGLVFIIGALLEIVGAVNLLPENMMSIGVGLIAVASAIKILSISLNDLGAMSWEEILKGLATLCASLFALSTAMESMKDTIGGSRALLVAVSALVILVPVLKILGGMSWESIIKGLTAIAGSLTILGVSTKVLAPLIPQMLALSAAVALAGAGMLAAGIGMAAFAAGFATLSVAAAFGATAIVAAFTAMVAGVANLIPLIISKFGEGVVAFCGVIANGAPAIAKAIKAVFAECIPVLVEALLQFISSTLDNLVSYAPKIIDSLFEFIILILEGIAKNLPSLIQSAVDVVMSFFSGIIDALGSIDMSVLIQGLTGVGLIASLMIALAGLASLTPAAMAGVLGVAAVIAEIAGVIAAFGALRQIPGLEWLIKEGGNMLEAIGVSIGQFIGGIVGGVVKGITGQLPEVGTDLSEFMTNLQPFINGAKQLDEKTVNGIRSLAETILILTASNVLEGLTAWFTGGNSLASFANDLAALGPALQTFSSSSSTIEGDNIQNAASAIKTIADMSKTLPAQGGVVQWFTGTQSLSVLASELVKLGPSLLLYSNSVTGLKTDNIIDSVKCIKPMCEAINDLPAQGGIAQWFTGTQSLSVLAGELAKLGPSLMTFGQDIVGLPADDIIAASKCIRPFCEAIADLPAQGGIAQWFTGTQSLSVLADDLKKLAPKLKEYGNSVVGLDADSIISSARAIRPLCAALADLPPQGGIAQWFTGSQSLSVLADDLKKLSPKLKEYANSIIGLDSDAIIASAKALKPFCEAINSLPAQGGIAQWFTGTQSLATLAEELKVFGPKFKEYGDSVVGLKTEEITAASAAIMSVTDFTKKLIESGVLTNTTVLTTFGNDLLSFAGSFDGYATKMHDINTSSLTMAIDQTNKIIDLATTVSSLKLENMTSFGNALTDMANAGINGFIDAFRNAEKDVKSAASKLIEQFISGINEKKNDFVNSFKNFPYSAVLAIRDYYDNFYNIGGYLASGLAAGLSSSASINKVIEKAKDLAKAAENAARNELQVESPSKKFAVIGSFVAKGFIKGIEDEFKPIKDSIGNRFGNIISWSFNSAIRSMKDSLAYGRGAFDAFAKRYLKHTNDMTIGTKAIEAASKAIIAYGEKLYKASSYYEDDIYYLNEDRKALKALEKGRDRLQKKLDKAQKENTKKSKKRVKELKNELAEYNKAIKIAKKQIKIDQDEIAAHTKEVFNDLRNSLSDSISEFIDPLSMDITSGIDLFAKFESDETLLEEDEKNLERHQKELEDLKAKRDALEQEMISHSYKNTLAERLELKRLNAEIAELEASINETAGKIAEDESNIASHNSITVDTILSNMESQIEGVQKWRDRLQELTNRGLPSGLIEQLKEMGVQGVNYVDQFIKMTGDELKKAGELFSKSEAMSSQALIDNFKDSLSTARKWADGLQQMASLGFDQSLIEKLGDMGVHGKEYVDAFLSMSAEQIAEFNKEYADSLKLPENLADKVISSYAYAGGQSVEGFVNALAALTQDGTTANTALKTTVGQIGEIIEPPLSDSTKKAGKKASDSLAMGILNGKDSVKKSSKDVCDGALTNIRSVFSKKAGSNLAKNLISGLKNGLADSSAVSDMAAKMAKSAYSAARKTLGIKSPSKKFEELGRYIDEGFAKGILSGERGVYKTTSNVMGEAISRALDAINNGDNAEPVIRPVMDLSEIQNGVGDINKMMNGYVLSGSVNVANDTAKKMEGYVNTSDDLISKVVNKLQKTISDISDKSGTVQNNTFNITGSDPRETAEQISHILQRQVERRSAAWA